MYQATVSLGYSGGDRTFIIKNTKVDIEGLLGLLTMFSVITKISWRKINAQ